MTNSILVFPFILEFFLDRLDVLEWVKVDNFSSLGTLPTYCCRLRAHQGSSTQARRRLPNLLLLEGQGIKNVFVEKTKKISGKFGRGKINDDNQKNKMST